MKVFGVESSSWLLFAKLLFFVVLVEGKETQAQEDDDAQGDQGGNLECPVTINLGPCDTLIQGINAIEDCDCYNFCNGNFLSCCEAGAQCALRCNGELSAGCTFGDPTEPPTTFGVPTELPTTFVGLTELPTDLPSSIPSDAPSLLPSEVPSVAPVSAPVVVTSPTTPGFTPAPSTFFPTLSPGTCLVQVGTEKCSKLMEDVETIEECDCYNFCNNGQIACCQFGEPCVIQCNGNLVAGCLETDIEPLPMCLVEVNAFGCEPLIETQSPVDDCDCYNYCEGELAACCKYNEFCPFNCDSAAVVAGCTLDGGGGGPPVLSPVSSPVAAPTVETEIPAGGAQYPVFFWPDGFTAPKRENTQEIII